VIVLAKFIIHLGANNIYGLHRDEYLYFAEGQHLAWGYMEGPPMIGFLAWIAQLFGGSPFVIRLLPALIGAASIFLIGTLVKDLGGKKWAVFLACLAFIISPAFLRSNMLFQPVSFNQFFWLLSAFWLVRIIRYERNQDWYFLGITIGLGLMTKYSIIFFVGAMLLASLFSRQMVWFKTRYPYIAMIIAFVLFLPNLVWQWHHHFPVLDHMRELAETQLVHVDTVHFFVDQFQNQLGSSVIWFAGLLYLLFSRNMRDYRMFGFGFLFLLAIIYMLGGKTYYTLGIYPILFVFGGLAIEHEVHQDWIKWVLVVFMMTSNAVFSPYAIPFISAEKMQNYCAMMKKNLGLDGPLRWEDGSVRQLPQDYADMFGWEEIAQKVGRIYHALPDSARKQCHIYGGSYGHAGAINYFQKKYNLPEAHSLSASFLIWARSEIHFNNQILIDDRRQDSSSWFNNMILVDSIQNPYARDPGYIYFRTDPRVDLQKAWKDYVREFKSRYNF
jgi:4-amino-4-deoxy-L-arabinose transferase-like glycosyltransferase